MITGSRVLLLICIFMLFIYDYQSQVLERKKNGRTNPQYHIIFFVSQLLLPDFHTFGIRKLRMVNAETMAEYPLQAFGYLSSQSNLRQ